MKCLSRVVWSEGMYLGPHHFQAQSRYFEDSIRFVAESLWPETYGLAGIAWDEEALGNGTVSIVHARGIMPDGAVFHIPESDAMPESRNITSVFPPASDKITVFLTIPGRKYDGVNCALTQPAVPNGYRYIAENEVVPDETTGRDDKPVRIGRKNLRLVVETELTPDLITLPVARVMRSGSGKFIFDPAFIPPCLQISASDRLLNLLGSLIQIMEEKTSALSIAAEVGGDAATFSTREIANFWFLHTINASLAPLRHFYFSKRGHPEELYLELSRLAGALCTFNLQSHPRTLPPYDHGQPDACFDALDRHIREHLELIIPTNCLVIPLHTVADYFYAGEVSDERCLGRSNWYLALHADLGDVELIANVPRLVKVCSERFVAELVKRALPGLELVHVPVPPPAIKARVGTHYFLISRTGTFWDHIVATRHVGVYVPGDIPHPEIQLLAVLDS
jgi:type VI secretion system protein ImpJ